MMNRHVSWAVHCSTGDLGGAERSVLEWMTSQPGGCDNIRYILPEKGTLSAELKERAIPYDVLPWPGVLKRLHQRGSLWQARLWLLPFYAGSFFAYWRELKSGLRKGERVLSSGVKSHVLMLPLLWTWKGDVLFNVRDFIKPLWFRRVLAAAIRLGGGTVVANSRAVASDYAFAEVVYPKVALKRPVEDRRNKKPLVFTHVGFFAPYKGQLQFLEYARQLLQQHPDSEFWLLGDVIYPGTLYRKYKAEVLKACEAFPEREKVKWWGRMDNVQSLLEQSHYLLHCTLEPEPFGRVVPEGLLCGCRVLCHEKSGVCETLDFENEEPDANGIHNGLFLPHHRFVKIKSPAVGGAWKADVTGDVC